MAKSSDPRGAARYPVSTDSAGPVVGRPEALRGATWLPDGVWRAADRLFPVRLTRAWWEAMRPEDPQDPLGLQALPSAAELEADAEGLLDPVGEAELQPLPWLVQKHPDRALLLVTRRCHLYCRYCFRRNHDSEREDPTPDELDRALDWIRASGVRELLLSGGDPLAVRDERLFHILDAVRPEVPVVRIHTRAPITRPDRVTEELVRGLAERRPVWVLVHANHPRELSEPVRAALRLLRDAGLPVLNQAVLLRGVNDQVDVLAELCELLVELGVFPYYLHHTDAAQGNASFRVDPRRGLQLHEELARRVSGIALPRYVVDLPDGSGKIDVRRAMADAKMRPRRT